MDPRFISRHIEPVYGVLETQLKMKLHDKVQTLIGILTVICCILSPNLENLTSIGDDLLRGQAENGFFCVFFFYFQVQFDLEGQC